MRFENPGSAAKTAGVGRYLPTEERDGLGELRLFREARLMNRCKGNSRVALAAGGMFALSLVGAGCAMRQAQVNAAYTVRPEHPLPPEVRTVAVEWPNYTDRATDNGIIPDKDRAYYRMAVRRLEEHLRGANITLVDREDMINRRTERDYAGAEREDRAPQGITADAVIVARSHVEFDTNQYVEKVPWFERWPKSLIPYVPIPDDPYRSRWIVIANADIDLQFSATATGAQFASYADVLIDRRVSDEGFFGIGEKPLWEMPTPLKLGNDLIDQGVDNFCAQFLPVRREFHLDFGAVPERLADAADALSANDVTGARLAAEECYQKGSRDHRLHFLLGLINEIEGDMQEAGRFYQLASGKQRPDDPFYGEYTRALHRAKRGVRAPAMAQGDGRVARKVVPQSDTGAGNHAGATEAGNMASSRE